MAPSRFLANVTLTLAVLAAVLLQVALYDRQSLLWPGWVQLGGVVLTVLLAARLGGGSRRVLLSVGSALFFLPFVWDFVTRRCFSIGEPSEIQLAYGLRNLMLVLAATRSDLRAQHFAGLASFFLVLFSFLWSTSLATTLLLIVYTLLGMWWLLGCYWDGIQGRLSDQSEQAIPVRPALTAIAIAVALMAAALPVARSERVTRALSGFFPSSGGGRFSDQFAHGGVGDGDQMVAAKDEASTFGPIESDLFLESKMPSLYDVYNESSEPAKRKKRKGRRRAIPLAPSAMQQNHKRRGINQQAKREFDTVRTRSSRPKEITEDKKSPALLQVRGRVPVHLGIETYDTWDGQSLGYSGAAESVYGKLDRESPDGRTWLRLSQIFPSPLFGYTDVHQLRIVNLRTDRIPAPPNLSAVNLDGLHTVNFFRYLADGALAIDGPSIPQLTVMNVESRRHARSVAPRFGSSPPTEPESRLTRLAREWTAGVERGWPQVRAIRDRLRTEYQLDPTAMVPEDCENSVEHFLFTSRRGPDYLFATSAALLMRSLGFDTRVRSGLYARPENYDRFADLTPVYKDDAHFWLEVRSLDGFAFDESSQRRNGSWLTVDPSPGYEVLDTPKTLLARITAAAVAAARAVAARPVPAATILGLLALVLWFRVVLLDRMVTAWWRLSCGVGDARHRVLATVRLLERRAWLRNQPRRGGTTVGRWQLGNGADSPEAVTLIKEFQRIASWAIYGEGVPAAAPSEHIDQCCREAARSALRAPGQRRRSDR